MSISGLTPYHGWPVSSSHYVYYKTLCGDGNYAWVDPKNGGLRLARVSKDLIRIRFVEGSRSEVKRMYAYGSDQDIKAAVDRWYNPPIPLHEAMHIAETFVLMGFFNENDAAK